MPLCSLFPLLDIPVEATECGTQTEWDDDDGDGRCVGNGWCDGDCNSDGIDDCCDGDCDGARDGDASATVMDGAMATVIGGAMTTALEGNDGNVTVTTAMDGLTAIEEVEDNNSICFMTVKILDAFIPRGTSHVAKCGSPLVLMQRKAHFCGSMLHKIWKCQCCGEELVFDNQHRLGWMWLQREHISPVSNQR